MDKKFLFGFLLGTAISCCLFIFFISITFPSVEAGCQNEPCDDPPCCNGDVNGDGNIDLSDPIGLLTYLFADGLPPQDVMCRHCPAHELPATGQENCYNEAGSLIACDSTECPGQDGFYQAGCPVEGRFVDNGDGTITDQCTGLMWQKDTADIPDDADDKVKWADALQYCENLKLAGHDDWRLPNIRELHSIVDYGKVDPAIDPVFNAELSRYWSAGTNGSYTNNAWVVSFFSGIVHDHNKTEAHSVRAVRTIPPGE